ncbi:coiled-coil domain-containing protein 86 [Castor canadensis]|uniref:Coiled-coil domain-containing protein 86 n=1 Tax=Castor canadensis TaxID=51338 RepID=A0A8B7VKW9_CASCN
MNTPLRRSRRLEGLNPETAENVPAASQARRALVEFKPGTEETREPGSPVSVRQHDLGFPSCQPDLSPGSPTLRQDADLESPRRQPEQNPKSLQRQQDPRLELLPRQPEPSPEAPRRAESPKLSQDQEQLDSEGAQGKEELTPGSPQSHQDAGLESPPGQPELSSVSLLRAESPKLSQDQEQLDSEGALGKEELAPGSPQRHQDAGLESPPGQPEPSSVSLLRAESPKLSQDQGELDSEGALGKEELAPGSPQRHQDAGLESPPGQPEPSSVSLLRAESPKLSQDQGELDSEGALGKEELAPGSPQHQQDPGLESPPRQPEPSSVAPQRAESPKLSQDEGELDPERAPGKEELTPESPQRHLQPGPESPEPHPVHQAPSPQPSKPPEELTPQAPGSPGRQQDHSKTSKARKTETGSLCAKRHNASSTQAPPSKKLKKEEEKLPEIPKGKPKSGRVWKDRSKKRFSQMVQDKPLHTSWQRKMKERQERKLTKDFARHLVEERERRRQEKKQRRAENLKRRLENERKAEIVQVIRNPAKLKRAKKQQLRSIQKRDTLALLQKQPPQRPEAQV